MNFDMNKIDLTNGSQKFFAVILLGIVLGILYYLLPPLVEIFKNLVILGGLLLVVIFAAFNYRNIWMLFKQISFYLTKKIVSSNPVWYMYNYHTFILNKIDELEKSIINVSAIKDKLHNKIAELNSLVKENISKVETYKTKGATENQIRILANKIATDQKQLEVLVPRFKTIEKQEKYLQELADFWKADAEDLKYTLDAKADQYNTLKELAKVTGTASEFLKGNSDESKDYQLSIKLIEESCNQYTANVQNFERKAKPILESMALNREVNVDIGLQLIEEFKQKSVKLSLPSINADGDKNVQDAIVVE